MQSIRYSCQILKKLEFSRNILEKLTNIKFHVNPSIGGRVVTCGWTDRHDEDNSLLRNFANKPTKRSINTVGYRRHRFFTYIRGLKL